MTESTKNQDLRGIGYETGESLIPCPFCGKSRTLSYVTVADINRSEELDPAQDHSYVAINCDGSNPDGPGGCGATGGFAPTLDEARRKWNMRAESEEESA